MGYLMEKTKIIFNREGNTLDIYLAIPKRGIK